MVSAKRKKAYARDIEEMKLYIESYEHPPRVRYAQSYAIGNTYDALSEDREATAWYQRALDAHRESTDIPSTELGILCWKLGRHEEARSCFRQVIAYYQRATAVENSDDARRQISRKDKEVALSYMWLGDYEKALQIANDYLEGRRGFGHNAAIYIAISIAAGPLKSDDIGVLSATIDELETRFPNARPADISAEMEIRRLVLKKLQRQTSSN